MDWFTIGMNRMHKHLAEDAELSLEQFKAAYAVIYNEGLIDYDVEKEIIYDGWLSEEERNDK